MLCSWNLNIIIYGVKLISSSDFLSLNMMKKKTRSPGVLFCPMSHKITRKIGRNKSGVKDYLFDCPIKYKKTKYTENESAVLILKKKCDCIPFLPLSINGNPSFLL